jgi:hypothetical protein
MQPTVHKISDTTRTARLSSGLAGGLALALLMGRSARCGEESCKSECRQNLHREIQEHCKRMWMRIDRELVILRVAKQSVDMWLKARK